MVKKVEIAIEKFNEGITLRWRDLESKVLPSKRLAINGNEAEAVGEEIWGDISELLDDGAEKLNINIEYTKE